MKLATLITISSMPFAAFAGEPAAAPMEPTPAAGDWFVGATYGMLEADSNADNVADGEPYNLVDPKVEEFEFDMYTLHFGRDLNQKFLGCDLAAYAELGYITGDATLQDFGRAVTNLDIEIIPITFNLKAERELYAGIKGYLSAGIGYAFTDYNDNYSGDDGSDSGFYAQAQIGLAYDINENWEIYGGARWLYLGGLDFGDNGVELDNSLGYEIGVRYHF
jgi:opacity protein-like surface antigen